MEIARCKRRHFYDKSASKECPECAAMGALRTVPVEPVAQPSSTIAKCDRGHYYDGSLGSCPVCAAGAFKPEKKADTYPMVRCQEGHLYDASIHQTCPECAMDDIMKTVPVSQMETSMLITENIPMDDEMKTVPVDVSMQIVQCDKGHYYDRSIGDCPLCAAAKPVETEPVVETNLVTCPNGHIYDSAITPDCPECAAMEEAQKTVAVDQMEPSMLIAQCANGHYYDAGLGECPICAAAKPIETEIVAENKLVQCSAGHLYDPSVSPQCPECAAMEEDDMKTVPVDFSMQIVQCDKGHYYDRSIGDCPICAAAKSVEAEPVVETNLVTCPNGHIYDSTITPDCPECAAMEEEEKTVAVDQMEPSMLITQCANGHYYDAGLGECPICAAAKPVETEPVVETNLVTCPNGHIYDSTITSDCPECAAVEEEQKTVAVDQMEPSVLITQCLSGHYYDAGLGECPVCAAAKPLEESTISAEEQAQMQTVSKATFEYTQQCEKGHYYKPELKECPICAQEAPELETIPASEFEFSIQVVQCKNGHSYDASLGECPVCAAEKPVQYKGTKLMVCSAGHKYDPVITPECPECARKKPLEAEPKVQVKKCEKGHYFDAALGQCPICAAEAQTAPKINLVTCAEGHLYDKAISEECPFCAAAASAEVEFDNGFTEVEDMKNTLLFTAFGGLSFRLWKDGEQMKLTARSLLRKPCLILERTVSVPEQKVFAAAYRIQSVLFTLGESRDRVFLSQPGVAGEKARLLFKTVQISCDYQWKEPADSASPAANCMRQIHAILGQFLDPLKGGEDYPMQHEDVLAQLQYGLNASCRILRGIDGLQLELRDWIYYDEAGLSYFIVGGRVKLSDEETTALLRMLAESGIMEALVRRSLLPQEECFDRGCGTSFKLTWNRLSFSYLDGIKVKDSGAAGKAEMEKAYEQLLQAYIRHNK